MMLPLQLQLSQITGYWAPAAKEHSPYPANLILTMTLEEGFCDPSV